MIHAVLTDRRAGLLVTGLVALVLGLTACGRGASEVTVASPGAPQATTRATPAAPVLPPVAQRSPDRFDANGCLRTGPTTVDCTQTASAMDRAAAGTGPTDWRTLAGFVGRYYTDDVAAATPIVVEPSITTSPTAEGSRWSAVGLARNETAAVAGSLVVSADLLDASGAPLDHVTTTSTVTAVRPGEPVPFSVASATTPFASVASVRWSVTAGSGTTDAGARGVELTTYWSRPFGDPKPIDFYLHTDGPGAHPYVLFGSALDHGRDVTTPRVVVAWLDASGRVVEVRTVAVSEPDGSPATVLHQGTARDFIAVIDDAAAADRAGAGSPMLWSTGT